MFVGPDGALPVLAEEKYVKADTLEQLAEACGMDVDVLTARIANWAFSAEQGCDYQFGRDAATICAFARYIRRPAEADSSRARVLGVVCIRTALHAAPGSTSRCLAQAVLGLLG